MKKNILLLLLSAVVIFFYGCKNQSGSISSSISPDSVVRSSQTIGDDMEIASDSVISDETAYIDEDDVDPIEDIEQVIDDNIDLDDDINQIDDSQIVTQVDDSQIVNQVDDPQIVNEEVIKLKKNIIIGNYFKEGVSKRKDSKNYKQTGEWRDSNLKGYKKSISRYSADYLAKVEYHFNMKKMVVAPSYCLMFYRVTHENSIDKALLKIYEGGKILDQQIVNFSMDVKDASWITIGSYGINREKNLKVVLERGDENNGGFLRADEMKLKKLKQGYDCAGKLVAQVKKQKIIDYKRAKNVPGYREVGEWRDSSYKGYKGSYLRYSQDEDARVNYYADLTYNNYCLSFYKISHPYGTPEAEVTLNQNGRIVDRLFLNLSEDNLDFKNKSRWIDVGEYNFDEQGVVEVSLRKIGEGLLITDALRFKQGSCKQNPLVQ